MDKSVSIRAVICVHPCYGGGEGTRTPDLLNAIQTFSQLNYTPILYSHLILFF